MYTVEEGKEGEEFKGGKEKQWKGKKRKNQIEKRRDGHENKEEKRKGGKRKKRENEKETENILIETHDRKIKE